MIYIAHRGNTNGPNPKKENTLTYVLEAINDGYHAEIDVWYMNNKWYLGHDKPVQIIEPEMLEYNKLWCHAKNYEAFYRMVKNEWIHCFWHQNDDMTLTSKNFIWTFPGKQLTARSIAVMPETVSDVKDKTNLIKCYNSCAGICSDYVRDFRHFFEKDYKNV